MKVFCGSMIFFLGFFLNFVSTSIIIIEDAKACFRRVLAGKRVSRAFVKRAMTCETVEECQMECADEKRFSCEGFNYRLDPTGRGKGDCELIYQPLSRLDIGRDLYPHPDYDYYERDRNAAPSNCNRYSSGDSYGGYDGHYHASAHDYGYRRGGYHADRRYDQVPRRPDVQGYGPPPGDRWTDVDSYRRRPFRPEFVRKDDYDRDYRPSGNRRGDFSLHSHHIQDHHYQTDRRYYQQTPPLPPKPDPYEPYLPLRPQEYPKDKPSLGAYLPPEGNNRRNYYLPPKPDRHKDWGLYGGTYGNGYHHHGTKQSYNYWGLDKYEHKNSGGGTGGYLPPKPSLGSSLAPVPKPQGTGGYPYVPPPVGVGGGSYLPVLDNSLLPVEPRKPPPTYNFIKDECSLRTATGFRLHKGIVKKYFAVPNIYECELLCFREKEFPCSSYAYRYTVTLSVPTDNCYLSNRNYKELDYYTDLEPDRDFDIYTMNNVNRCEEPILQGRDHSDCFWRVRSGQRLDHKVVKDSLTTKSIVDCQIECLRSTSFTCRAFSYRYGSPVIGGSIDNCQLTDWPFYELDPRAHFIPEPGFEVYERGSYGHGCEPDHFGIRGQKVKPDVSRADQLCYIGFGSPARLLPQAIKKSLNAPSELSCKEECSKARSSTLFQCMSFSFRTAGDKSSPNCLLSDIYQRDLLPNMDYVYDADSWLFAWDNYNPECVALSTEPLLSNHVGDGFRDRNDFQYGLDTWRVYSVSGWPCRRGALCQENRETGFWFCELEGGEKGAWDYCCRPDHQCGASHGYPYQWCFVGPAKTQWRKCSDQYFPYIHNIIDRVDHVKPYLPTAHKKPWGAPAAPHRPPIRPDRPPAPPHQPPPRPSLNQYEMIFDEEFLEPPKPGGFGQPRHWPLSYLHKGAPPNTTDARLMRMEKENPKYAAIQNLISVIKSNDLNNVQYHIANDSNKADDILFVKIPLPTNFTRSSVSVNTSASLEAVSEEKRSPKVLQLKETSTESTEEGGSKPSPVYRRGFVTRTNVTAHGRHFY